MQMPPQSGNAEKVGGLAGGGRLVRAAPKIKAAESSGSRLRGSNEVRPTQFARPTKYTLRTTLRQYRSNYGWVGLSFRDC
jgi:hypothetical protein